MLQGQGGDLFEGVEADEEEEGGRWQGQGEGEGGGDLFEECDTLFQHFNMSLTPQF